jgi:hypothetical protein
MTEEMLGLEFSSRKYILATKLNSSLDAIKDHLGLELVLHRGLVDVNYRGGHNIRLLWSSWLSKYLAITSGLETNNMSNFSTSLEVIKWLLEEE